MFKREIREKGGQPLERLAVMTVGKTHSGKTTFAHMLAGELPGSVVIDQDLQAKFLNKYYPQLLPKNGPNLIKNALTRTVAEHAVENTDCHLIISNSNLSGEDRRTWLDYYKEKGFTTVLVFFNLSEDMLRLRIRRSTRSTNIFRVSLTFGDLLDRQLKAYPATGPSAGEADHLLTVHHGKDVEPVIGRILDISRGKGRRA